MNSKSQAASCCLDDRQIEHEYKRPTLVAPLDSKSSAHFDLGCPSVHAIHVFCSFIRSYSSITSRNALRFLF
ncbi:hypothetical protein FOFC_07712 [Fusarium oxysporum]|nr:hypothetical protein FOFC_07712 [Fusarium oxysporum]